MSDEAKQGSGAWLYERCGYRTASRFKDILDFTAKGKSGAKRETYLWETVNEIITGQPTDHFTNAAMEWGSECEPASRMAAEAKLGMMIEQTGFLKHPTLPMVGGSPDGLIDDDGGWESKSPFNPKNHYQTILNGMPEEHMPQIQGLMWITGRQWWIFQSYDPRLPENLRLYQQRIERNDEYIQNLEKEVIAFSAEVNAIVAKLTQ